MEVGLMDCISTTQPQPDLCLGTVSGTGAYPQRSLVRCASFPYTVIRRGFSFAISFCERELIWQKAYLDNIPIIGQVTYFD